MILHRRPRMEQQNSNEQATSHRAAQLQLIAVLAKVPEERPSHDH
jgi:hypothetical protein